MIAALVFLAVAIHVTPQDLVWRAAPPPYPPGVQMTVLEGTPQGQSTVRLHLPAGTKLAKESRSRTASVTVMSGNVTVDGDAFGPGSFFVINIFDGDIVATDDAVLQVSSDAPWLRGEPALAPGPESVVPLRSDDADLTLIDATPASYADVTTENTIRVHVHYVVKHFAEGAFNLSPMFESTRPGVTQSPPQKGSTRPYPLTAPSGDMTIDIPVGELLARGTVARPLHMWVYLLQRTGEHSSRPLVRTPTLVYNVR